jgi:RHS repeat-associated protein
MITQSDSTKNLAKQMAYDSYNRIRQVTDQYTGTVKGQYWYDDQGFRVRREAVMDANGEEHSVQLLYPSMYFSVETQKYANGVPVEGTGFGVNNVYLNGVRVAAVLPNCDAQYYLTDQVDSVKVVTNDSGLVVTSHEYLPFGEDWITEGDTKNAPKYNSQELDKESGYYFYNARHYDPEIGRFVTPDTVIDGELSTQGWNRFAYVHNNPIRYKDPTGHSGNDIHFYDTKKWASSKEGGFSEKQAEIIATADKKIDSNLWTSYLPIVGDQKRHFNTSKNGIDSRLVIAAKHLISAANLQKEANIFKELGKKNSAYNYFAEKYEKKALETLGKGLHSLQDYYAHDKNFQKDIAGIIKYHDSIELNEKKKILALICPPSSLITNPDYRSKSAMLNDDKYKADNPDYQPERYKNINDATIKYFKAFRMLSNENNKVVK